MLRDWTWKTKDHPRFSLVTQTQPDHRLEKGGNHLETLQNRLETTLWRIRETQQPRVEEVDDEDEGKNHTTTPMEEDGETILIEMLEGITWINKTNIATELAIEENSKKAEKTDEELVPEEYHDYLDIFSEEKAHRFPEPRSWDHKIEMKEGFEPKSFKNYNLTPAEQLELDKFLKENLEKGYIRPSQSPMASPFFFVSKKDG